MTTWPTTPDSSEPSIPDFSSISGLQGIASWFDLDQFYLAPSITHVINEVRYDVLMLTSQKPLDRHSFPPLLEVPRDEIGEFRRDTASSVKSLLLHGLLPDTRKWTEGSWLVTVMRPSVDPNEEESKVLWILLLKWNKEIQDRLSNLKGTKDDLGIVRALLPIVSLNTIQTLQKNTKFQNSLYSALVFDLREDTKGMSEERNFHYFRYMRSDNPFDMWRLASQETEERVRTEFNKIKQRLTRRKK